MRGAKGKASGWALALLPAALFAADAQVEAARQCAQQKDSLQRLVCYDGLFQQAEAPAARVTPAPAPAAAAPVVPAAIVAAPAVVAAAPATSAAPPVAAAAAAPMAAAVPPAPVPAAAPAMGDDTLKKPAQEKADSGPNSLEAKVTAVKETRPDTFRVTLDNGQIWQQMDTSKLFYVRPGDLVRIERGSMGSFRMAQGNGSNWVRVTRVQ